MAHRADNRHQAGEILTDLAVANLRSGHPAEARRYLESASSVRATVPDQVAEESLRAAWREFTADCDTSAGRSGSPASARAVRGRPTAADTDRLCVVMPTGG